MLALVLLLEFSRLSAHGNQATPPDALRAGQAALEDRLYDVAQKQLENVLREAEAGRRSADEAETAVTLLLRALYEQRKYAEILRFLDDNRRWLRKADSGIIPFWRAMARYELGAPGQALAELSGFETKYPNSEYASRVERLRAWCYLKQGLLQDALAAFARFDQNNTNAATAAENRLEWGRALLAAGRAAEAREVLTALAGSSTNQTIVFEGQYWLGRALVETHNWTDAIAWFSALATNQVVHDDLRAEAWFALAAVHQAQTNMESAIQAYRAGIEQALSPDVKRKGTRTLGLLLLNLGRIEDAVALLKPTIAAAPEEPAAAEAQLILAGALQATGRYNEASVEYQHYLETFTNNLGRARAYQGLGWCLMNSGRLAEAATAFQKAYETFTSETDKEQCLFKVGDAYFANGQYKLAAEVYARLAAEYTNSAIAAEALLQQAESLVRANESEAAVQVLTNLLTRAPDLRHAERALFRIAEIKASEGNLVEAVQGFSQVIDLYSNGTYASQALLGRAMANYRRDNFGAALQDFEHLVKTSPTNVLAEEASFWSGFCHYWLGNEDKALSILRDFVNRYPDSPRAPRALFWTGEFEFNRGNFQNAEQLFLMFVERFPNDSQAAEALLWAGRAASMRGEYRQAIDILARAVKEYPDAAVFPEIRFAQGDALANLTQFSEAILAFQEVINRFPDSELAPQTWLKKGDCEFMLGAEDPKRYEEAMRSYRAGANNPNAGLDLALEAEYKIGRCLEKLGRNDEAVEQYYTRTVVRFMEAREKGAALNEDAKKWFLRACYNLADIFETRKAWRQVVSIFERVVSAGLPLPDETRERIRRIRTEYWWLFR